MPVLIKEILPMTTITTNFPNKLSKFYYDRNNLNLLHAVITTDTLCSCKFCKSNKENMPLDLIEKIFSLNIKSISLYGGESLLYLDTCKYIAKKCKEKNFLLDISSICLPGTANKINEIKPDIFSVKYNPLHLKNKEEILKEISKINKSIEIRQCFYSGPNCIDKPLDILPIEEFKLESTIKKSCTPCLTLGLVLDPSGKLHPLCTGEGNCLFSDELENFDKIKLILEKKRFYIKTEKILKGRIC
jgi:hypothetical protein